jgi:hypothetical protein
MTRTVALVPSLLALFAAGCGGGPEPRPAPAQQPGYGLEEEEEDRGGVAASGIMGTIPILRIQEKFEMRLRQIDRCFLEREPEVQFIGGHVEFYFRVALDGTVRWAYMRDSSVGDRQTERCLLDIVRRIKFPRPRGGGEAEIGWSFDRDPNPEVRPPVELEPSGIGELVSENAESIAACGIPGSTVTVTAYVAPGGQVIAAGAHSTYRGAAEDAILDCVTETVSGWTMPDPGSYAAKISFDLP